MIKQFELVYVKKLPTNSNGIDLPSYSTITAQNGMYATFFQNDPKIQILNAKKTLVRNDIIYLKRKFGIDQLSVARQIKPNLCTEYAEIYLAIVCVSDLIMIIGN